MGGLPSRGGENPRRSYGEALALLCGELSVGGVGDCQGPRVAGVRGISATRSCGTPWCSRMCLNYCAGASVSAFPSPQAISPFGTPAGTCVALRANFRQSVEPEPWDARPLRRRAGRPLGTRIIAFGPLWGFPRCGDGFHLLRVCESAPWFCGRFPRRVWLPASLRGGSTLRLAMSCACARCGSAWYRRRRWRCGG